MFEFEASEVFKIKEFTFVNDCFKDKHNEEIGHSGQTLMNYSTFVAVEGLGAFTTRIRTIDSVSL